MEEKTKQPDTKNNSGADALERIKKLIEANGEILDNVLGQHFFAVEFNDIVKILDEEIPVLSLIENGEGYREGIKTINGVYENAQKVLLDECCESLEWQGGTIHQVKEAIKNLVEQNKMVEFYKQALTKSVSLPKGVLPDGEQYYTEFINGQVEVARKMIAGAL